MTQDNKDTNITYCDDSQLAYDNSQSKFIDGHGLVFDNAYRLAHLPLVAPGHPQIIGTKPGTSYNRGIHDIVYSIVIPIYEHKLLSSENFITLCDEIKATKFAHKLSWDTFSKRKNKLHATICGAISTNRPPDIDKYLQKLSAIGPVSMSIRGLFSGNINIGRLYLKVYPELRNGKNMCHEIQKLIDSPLTDLYVVGLFNFVEELNSEQTRELKKLLDKWRNAEFYRSQLEELWLLRSRDDLVLDGSVEQVIPII